VARAKGTGSLCKQCYIILRREIQATSGDWEQGLQCDQKLHFIVFPCGAINEQECVKKLFQKLTYLPTRLV
jgi:hypothetical protein